MNNFKEITAAVCGFLGGVFSALFGGFDLSLTTLMIFMGIDFVTGLIVAGVFKKSTKTESGALSSDAGWRGLVKKGVILTVVLIAHRLDLVLGSAFIRDAVIIAFMVNEVISITENAGLMGINIPDAFKKAIELLRENADKKG